MDSARMFEACRIDPRGLRRRIAFRIEGTTNFSSYRNGILGARNQSKPLNTGLTRCHLLNIRIPTPFISLSSNWSKALSRAHQMVQDGAKNVHIYVVDLEVCCFHTEVFNANKLARWLGFTTLAGPPARMDTRNHHDELLVYRGVDDHCAVLAAIPAGARTIDCAMDITLARVPLLYLINLVQRKRGFPSIQHPALRVNVCLKSRSCAGLYSQRDDDDDDDDETVGLSLGLGLDADECWHVMIWEDIRLQIERLTGGAQQDKVEMVFQSFVMDSFSMI